MIKFKSSEEYTAWSLSDAAKNLARREEIASLVQIKLGRSEIAKARGNLLLAKKYLDEAETLLNESSRLAKEPLILP